MSRENAAQLLALAEHTGIATVAPVCLAKAVCSASFIRDMNVAAMKIL
jgi:hypothetical protein